MTTEPTWTLPEPPADYAALCQWYSANHATIKAIDSALYRAKRDLKQRITAEGPQRTPDGLVTLESDGYDIFPDKVMEVMPALIKEAKLTAIGDPAKVYRAAEMLEEEFGGAVSTAVVGVVDAVEFGRVVRMKGEAAALLEDCRTPRGRLSVKP